MIDFNTPGRKLALDDRGLKIILMLLFVVALMGSASIISEAIGDPKKGERFVSVRGVAEQNVKADLAIWPIRIYAAGNNLMRADQRADAGREKVLKFLRSNGVKPADIVSQDMRVQDRQAEGLAPTKNISRYLVEYTVLLRSTDVEKIQRVSRMMSKQINVGVNVTQEGTWDRGEPRFLFTKLNRIKPEMIARATATAHEQAKQFEDERNAHLGPVRRASQGAFTVMDQDDIASGTEKKAGLSRINKTVRVEVAVDYYLH